MQTELMYEVVYIKERKSPYNKNKQRQSPKEWLCLPAWVHNAAHDIRIFTSNPKSHFHSIKCIYSIPGDCLNYQWIIHGRNLSKISTRIAVQNDKGFQRSYTGFINNTISATIITRCVFLFAWPFFKFGNTFLCGIGYYI